MKFILKSFTLFFLVIFLLPQKVYSQNYNEDQIKLAFIFKIIDFIDNSKEFSKEQELCLFGFSEKDFNSLKETINLNKYNNISLSKKNNSESSVNCKIIYFSNNYSDFEKILDYTEKLSILTFAEKRYFLDFGGLVEFYKSNDKFRFRINNKLALSKGIRFNAKLLELSE